MMKKTWLAPALLGLVAAIACFVPMADYAFPGESAWLIACWKGFAPPVPHAPYPLMSVFARLLGGGNLLAPVCGVLSAVTLFLLVRQFVFARVPPSLDRAQRDQIAALAAAVAATVFLFSPAVRSSATHLEPRLFDFTWALLAAALALPFLRGAPGAGGLHPVLAGAAVALGLTDSALFLALLPLFLALVAQVARKGGRNAGVALLLFVLSGALTFFAARLAFGVDLGIFLRRTLAELVSYYKTPGWFFVFAFSTLPFLAVLFSEDGALGEKPGPVQTIFHGALSFVAVLAVATPLSPSSLMAPYGLLPVATSAFAAFVAGYLVAYWWRNRRERAARAAGGILLAALAGSVLWNLFTFDGRAGAFADLVARRIVADLDGRRTLVTDGAIDSHIRIAAAEAGLDLDLVSLARAHDAKVLSGTGNVTNDVAVFAAPDLLLAAGIRPVPERLFFGADERRVPDWSAWKDLDRILAAPADWGSCRDRRVLPPADRLRLSLRRYLGLVANNRGVYLEDRGRDDEAFGMYELVLREIDRDNVSALVNEAGMAARKHPAALAKKDQLERLVRDAAGDERCGRLLWRLGSCYGYVRDSEACVRRGWAWARSGRPGYALPKIRRLSAEDKALALDISRNDGTGAARHAREILRTNPASPLANYVMGSLALGEGRLAEAEGFLRKAADAREPVPLALNDLAEVLRRGGKCAEAERYARKCVDCAPAMYVAWETLGSVLMDEGRNLDEAESAIRRACELSKGGTGKAADVRMLVSLARVQLKKGDAARARVTVRKIRARIGELSDFERAEFEKLLKK